MKIKDLTIRSKLILGFGVILVFVCIIGAVALQYSIQLWDSTQKLYNHPFQVSKATRDIRGNIHLIREQMAEITLNQELTEKDVEIRVQKVDSLERVVFGLFDIVKLQYLGPQDDVTKAREMFIQYKRFRDKIITLRREGNFVAAVHYRQNVSLPFVIHLQTQIQKVIDFANNKAEEFFTRSANNKDDLFFRLWVLLAIVFITSLLLAYIIIQSIRKPVAELTDLADQYQEGNFDARSTNESTNEFGQLAATFNRMAAKVESDNLLKKNTAGISSDLLKGNDPEVFVNNLLSSLMRHTEAVGAALYILDQEEKRYMPFHANGLDIKNLRSFSARQPEGEFSLAVTDKTIQTIQSIPDDTVFSFPTASGTFRPKSLLTIPIIENEMVTALISLTTLHTFSDLSLRTISEIWPTLTASINGMLGYRKTLLYSHRLDHQNTELSQKSHELKVQSDELKEYTIELELQKKQLNEANRLKSEFLSNMSHELRTPLNSILALSNVLITRTKDKISEEESSFLEIVERNGRNLLNLINDILDLSKIEAGKIELNPKEFNIKEFLAAVGDSFFPLASSKGLQLELMIPEKLPAVTTDPDKLRQILTNIVGNAIKFTREGYVRIEAESRDQHLIIQVSDSGIGISEKDLPHIYDKFRQIDGSSSRRHEGTGLGLSIVQELLKKLGAGIQVESEPGKGSTFRIFIPLEWQGDEAEINYPAFQPADHQAYRKTVLVVDDDPEVVKELARYIREAGYNTLESTNGEQAIKLAETYQPFAITLDVIMPAMDGWEVLQQLKKNEITRHVPVIMVSVSSDKETGIALGAVGHIVKPVDRNMVLSEFNKLLQFPSTVMVVDDNKMELDSVAGVIESEDITVIKANGGNECIELLMQNVPDVLVLDLNMPETDGFMVLDFVRKHPQTMNLPVIIATAKDLSLEEKLLLNGKVASVLLKNQTTAHQIFNEVNRILKRIDIPSPDETAYQIRDMKRILIVEDNPDAVIQIKMILTQEGYQVDVASNGQEAVDFVTHTIPDGIILDLMMPGLDGFGVLEKMRGTKKTAVIPVLVLTAKTLTKEDLGKLSANNVQQLVQKGNVDPEGLLLKIRKMLHPQGTSVGQDIVVLRQKHSLDPEKMFDILIVEDNPDNMISVKAMLGNEYQIQEASDGETALRLLMEYSFSLILLDISLPGMSGPEVLKKMKSSDELMNIPVVALTARAMKGDREEFLAMGFDEYLAKPMDEAEFTRVINIYINKE